VTRPNARTRVLEVEREHPVAAERFTSLRRLASDGGHRLVVSLGGGSLPGLAGNLALLRILEELELRQHVAEVWGTSAGAVVGAGWASGAPAHDILELVASLDRSGSLDFSRVRFGLSILLGVWPFRRPLPDGLIRGSRFLETIARGLRVATFEDCPIPFRCIACSDDGRATRKVFRRGPLLPAVFSSMSLPGIVVPRPGDADGNCYYDGGLVEKSPLISPIADHGRSGDPRKLLLLCTHFSNEAAQVRVQGFHRRFLHTIYALEELCWSYQLAEARARENVVVVLLNPHLDDPSLFDFARTVPHYTAARRTFTDLLQNAKLVQTFGAS
jgi:predicted acylesterase/phospholipase RssA